MSDSKELFVCAFCDKSSEDNDVEVMVASKKACICAGCIDLARDFVGVHRNKVIKIVIPNQPPRTGENDE